MGKPRKSVRSGGKRGKEDALRRLNSEVKGMALTGSSKKVKTATPTTIEGCLEKARVALDTYDVAEAFRCCQVALQMDQDNVPALETMGAVLLERGDQAGAQRHFSRAVALQPDEGYAKYMSLAQLVEGRESLQHFLKGIRLMEGEKEALVRGDGAEGATALGDMDRLKELQDDVCRGHLSVAEMFMTDLCEEDDAATVCKRHLDAALETRPSAPEAHQLLASWCISMMGEEEDEDDDKYGEAKRAIERSVALWLPAYQQLTNEDEAGPSTSSASSADPVKPCPLTIEDRINAAKILIELFMMKPENDELANSAVEVLDTVLDEDDENVFVWYLLGWIGCMQGKEHYANSKLSLEQALLIISKKGIRHSGSQYGVDKDQIEAVLNELKSKIQEENVNVDEDDEDDDDDNGDEKLVDEEYETDDED